jgi:tRNA-modifying protein YgfZ
MEPTAATDHVEEVLGPRDVVIVDGPDAATYLHSQVTQDLQGMALGEHRWTFVLEPNGKVGSLARVTKVADERYELDTDAGHGGALLARLDRFKIRVKADTSLVPRPSTRSPSTRPPGSRSAGRDSVWRSCPVRRSRRGPG